ncbi:delta-sarcoglycan isoform X2 [Ictalurus punctatus]|uniref:Delta-sarcoglycan isoform X2 n=1 Tax=Ictalurus punctatus TaxID=7998 RepID=A0A979FBJ3_ICTPU|nr:delta-sarcoglycan isoform X2 [Ictalurus punctatus]
MKVLGRESQPAPEFYYMAGHQGLRSDKQRSHGRRGVLLEPSRPIMPGSLVTGHPRSEWRGRRMTQEQFTHRNNVQSTEKPHVYKVGIYGWRKRCLYFFVLLLMILVLVNLALTIWILKVMNFTIDGMGHLRITERGLKLEGNSEFLQPLYAKEIQSRSGSPLFLQSSKNISVNILNGKNQLVSQLVAGSHGVHARGRMLEVKSSTGKLLFSADDHEVVVGAERLRVLGAEGAVFSNSVETPHVRAEPFKELRSLWMLRRSDSCVCPREKRLRRPPDRLCSRCASVPTGNSSYHKQEQRPPARSATTSASRHSKHIRPQSYTHTHSTHTHCTHTIHTRPFYPHELQNPFL